MNKFEITALNQYLSDWPMTSESIEFEDVLFLLRNNNDGLVTIWEPFEYHSIEQIIELIKSLKELLQYEFLEKQYDYNTF